MECKSVKDRKKGREREGDNKKREGGKGENKRGRQVYCKAVLGKLLEKYDELDITD